MASKLCRPSKQGHRSNRVTVCPVGGDAYSVWISGLIIRPPFIHFSSGYSIAVFGKKNEIWGKLYVFGGEFKGAEIFYEGPESYKPNFPTKTLENIKETEKIILYSVPRNKERLKQLIKKTSANIIVENYNYVPQYSLEQFMKKHA